MPKEVANKTLELTNVGKGPYVVHDIENKQITILPGQSVSVELPGKVAERVAAGSDAGGTLKVGSEAKAELKRQKEEAEEERARLEAPPPRAQLKTETKHESKK